MNYNEIPYTIRFVVILYGFRDGLRLYFYVSLLLTDILGSFRIFHLKSTLLLFCLLIFNVEREMH